MSGHQVNVINRNVPNSLHFVNAIVNQELPFLKIFVEHKPRESKLTHLIQIFSQSGMGAACVEAW